MNKSLPKELERGGRTIKLVISDDGKDQFNFTVEGDIDRMGKIPVDQYSAAEYWGTVFFKVCDQMLREHHEIETLNREQRRKDG